MNNPDLILEYLKNKPDSSSKEIFEGVGGVISYATVKRQLVHLLKDNYILQQGNAKNTRYSLSAIYNLFYPVDLNEYYSRELENMINLAEQEIDL
jgi:predicted HTH transcriptional regulator